MSRGGRARAVFVSTSSIVWGAETSLLTTARHLQRQGERVGLLARAPGFVEQWPGPARLADGARLFAALARTALLERPEALVCCSLRLAAAFAPLRVLPRAVRPALVFDLHDYLPGAPGRRRMRLAMWWFDRVVAVSAFSAAQVSADHGAVLVLARPVEAGAGAGAAWEPRGRRVGVVGRLDADKRIEVAAEAVALLPDAALVLRGASGMDEGYTERLRGWAHELLGERVLFEGRVPRERVVAGLACVVVANEEEALGRTVAEAQLAGVPVVVPDRGGARELVEDGVTGWTFRAGSPRSLADAVRAVLDDPEGAAAVVARAREVAAVRHDPDRVAREYLRFAVSGPSARPLRALLRRAAGRVGERVAARPRSARRAGAHARQEPAVPAPRPAGGAVPAPGDTRRDLHAPR
ncbi:glycosyltransferase family 4 protein [Kineococcus gypseus]|uniref:glycosyltransferase family 4 protein n=1 Tax=Kineococcus gypseus TaxID=1637102 RepID=UPI003D7DA057